MGLYLGIDIGGMTIKAGLLKEDGKILYKDTITTMPTKDGDLIVNDIVGLINSILEKNNLTASNIDGIGIGSPGSIYDEKGIIRYSCNINFRNTKIVKIIKEQTGIKNVKVSNDANCAALGETKFGAGQGAKNSVMVTLGTGVGTGFVVNGGLLTGNQSAGAEGGHIQINIGGPKCGCGKKGCLEAYASATALMNQIDEAAKKNPESYLAKLENEKGLDCRILFEAAAVNDLAAIKVLKKYIKYVGTGLVNYANIFYPEVIIVGGGVANAGDVLINPLQKYVSKNVYGSKYSPKIKVVAATLKNDAGIIGAAALCM